MGDPGTSLLSARTATAAPRCCASAVWAHPRRRPGGAVTPLFAHREGVDALVVSVLRAGLGGSPALASIADGPGVAVVAAVADRDGADLAEGVDEPPAWAGGRLESWMQAQLTQIADAEDRKVLEAYAKWWLLRRYPVRTDRAGVRSESYGREHRS